jgi:hypothetical protein
MFSGKTTQDCVLPFQSPREALGLGDHASGQWFRSYGNDSRKLNADGLMTFRHASINDHVFPIQVAVLLSGPQHASQEVRCPYRAGCPCLR